MKYLKMIPDSFFSCSAVKQPFFISSLIGIASKKKHSDGNTNRNYSTGRRASQSAGKQLRSEIDPRLQVSDSTIAIAHIQSSLSNTIISITDSFGNVKTWCSSGTAGFKGSRRSTNYAAQATAETAARNAVMLGIRQVDVRIQGLGYGKESSLRGLQIGGLIITKIYDITPIPFNGCRPPKKRRV